MKHKILISLLALTGSLYAGTDNSKVPMTLAPEEDHWHFRAAPYTWLTAIEGDVRIGRLSAPVDISYSDTLDSFEIAYMGVIEATYDKWSIGIDTIYARTSQDLEGGGHLFRGFEYDQKQWIFTPTVAYRVIDTPDYRMDVFAGARITILEAELTGKFVGGGETTASRDKGWVDPIVGIRGQADFCERWFFRYNGDIGGFGAAAELDWQAFAGIGYNISQTVSIAVGYRAMGMDYDKDEFAVDTVSHGPVFGVEIRW